MIARKQQLDTLAIGLLLACSLFWGFQQVLVKATIPEIAPVFQASLRFAGATLVLWVWCRWRGIKLWGRDNSLRFGLLAGVLFAIEFALLFSALRFSTASRVTVFAYTAPLWVALLVPLFVRAERLRALQWLGVSLAFCAVLLALQDGLAQDAPPAQWLGDMLALGGGAAWGLTTVVIRATGLGRLSAEKLLFYQVAASGVLLPFLSLALGEPWSWAWSGFAVSSMVLQVLVGAFASYLAWMWLLGRYPARGFRCLRFLPRCSLWSSARPGWAK